jgi:hypothetical protein
VFQVFREPPAILAGAGVSLDSPSNLLAGWDFMNAILTRVLPQEVDHRIATSVISVPRGALHRPGEYVRFETLMGELVGNGIDPDLHVLDCLDNCDYPNVNHFILAELIRRGTTVITTNFDRLIEIAYMLSSQDTEPPLRVAHEDIDFPESGPAAVTRPTLWKLHGSLSIDGKPTRASLQSTLVQIMRPTLGRNKRRFMEKVIAEQDLLLVGYSGSDDLDLVPPLANTPSDRALVWIDHQGKEKLPVPRYKTAMQIFRKQKALTEYDVVGRDRVFFIRGHSNASPATNSSNAILLSAHTADVLQHVKERFCPDAVFPHVLGEYQFGPKYPDITRRYFDGWAAGCSGALSRRYILAIRLLNNWTFRPEIRVIWERLNERCRLLISEPNATPEERLEWLTDEFNNREHPDPPTYESRRADQLTLSEVEKLLPDLPGNLVGWGHRLAAHALWNLERHQEGEARFRRAWGTDRQLGRVDDELVTLTDWQRAAGSLRDIISFQRHQDQNALALACGYPPFPDEAFLRIQELRDQTGFQPVIQREFLRRFIEGYDADEWDEEDDDRRRLVLEETWKILRVAVDIGDVSGEVEARYLLANYLSDSGDYKSTTEQLVCINELERVIKLGEYGDRAQSRLRRMSAEWRSYAIRIRPIFRASMWV